MKCPDCGWSGDEGQMVVKEVPLEPEDNLYTVIHFGQVKRKISSCPKCGRPLRSDRYLYGSKHEGRNI